MVHYMGSKARHAAEIIRITCAGRRPGQAYVEPFVGGGNVICRVPPGDGPRIASDVNRYMVAMLDAVGNRGWLPPETMSEEEWLRIKTSPDDYPPELVAFVATGPTFGSVWMGPWASDPDDKPGMRYRQALDAVKNDAPGLKNIMFQSVPYSQINQWCPPSSIIYCDPPYAGDALDSSERGYGSKVKIKVGDPLAKNNWSTAKFWRWADAMVDAGHRVYVSEYAGPSPTIYAGATPELRAERSAAAERIRTIQSDSKSQRSDLEVAVAAMKSVEQKIRANAERLANRWVSLWEKEVTSDFHSEREAGVKEGKRETEHLFHRTP